MSEKFHPKGQKGGEIRLFVNFFTSREENALIVLRFSCIRISANKPYSGDLFASHNWGAGIRKKRSAPNRHVA
ncbi:MAG: hypothetical protein WCO68_10615 [Verrucomicrobiota bacterium]